MTGAESSADSGLNAVLKPVLPTLAVTFTTADRDAAACLAALLAVPLVARGSREAHDFPLVLELSDLGLGLRATAERAAGPVRCDFVCGQLNHRRFYGGGRGQAIAKAVGIGAGISLVIADLTAGLGRDGFVLASLGASVVLVERHPVVAALLADGLARARREAARDPDLMAILARLELVAGNGRDWLAGRTEADRPDIVYLDPMFPERTKSARVKKEMAVLQTLVGVDDDAGELLRLALAHARYRVVVKRACHAAPLGGRKPDHQLVGKSTRFDIYALKKIPG